MCPMGSFPASIRQIVDQMLGWNASQPSFRVAKPSHFVAGFSKGQTLKCIITVGTVTSGNSHPTASKAGTLQLCCRSCCLGRSMVQTKRSMNHGFSFTCLAEARKLDPHTSEDTACVSVWNTLLENPEHPTPTDGSNE